MRNFNPQIAALLRQALRTVRPASFADGYTAGLDTYWKRGRIPDTPEQIATLLADHTSLLIAHLHYPEHLNGRDTIVSILGHLAGLCAAAAEQYRSPSFHQANTQYFAQAVVARIAARSLRPLVA